jgi:ribonuclease Y
MNDMLYILLGATISAIIAIPLGIFIGFRYRKRVAEAEIGSAEAQARKILEDAIRAADTKKKEVLLEAKEEILASKNELENEIRDRRAELTRQEHRMVQKEESLDRKTEALERKEELLSAKIKEAEDNAAATAKILAEQTATLERISGFTAQEAKQALLNEFAEQITHEKAQKLAELETVFKESADEKSRNIIALAIQRNAADVVAETTVSSVPLQNEEMKGRIIGREGRNIRTIEQMTGVDLIIDDTPETITVSCFDPYRRDIARLALEKLLLDGRIHPTRIEEMVEKARKEVDAQVKAAGERATFETGIHGINPDLVRLLGRLKYRTSYGQNVLAHSIEVSILAGLLADELGVDSAEPRRAGLLHDIGKALTQEQEGSHVMLGVEVARKYHESPAIIHAIEAHHDDVEPQTITAMIVHAADAISAARPGARRENLENYIKRLQKLEEITTAFPGVERAFAIQAGREIRIMVKPEEVSDDDMILLSHDIARKIESELEYPGQIKVNIIRESRAVEYAK